MINYRNLKTFVYILFSFVVLVGCDKNHNGDSDVTKETVRIVSLSDTHFMDPSLLVSEGKAFDLCVLKDRKMIKESSIIMDEMISNLHSIAPDILLISGDMSKDGEEVSHKTFINKYLMPLKEKGVKIFVVPGNHDINNPEAMSFDGDNQKKVSTITVDEFTTLYSDYGYGSAIARDKSSLTYVAQPYANLRILGIDACKYDKNTDKIEVVGGAIRPQTMEFIKAQVADAKAKNIQIIAMMHHGLVEHWRGQQSIFKDYLVEDWKTQASELAKMGVKLIFTGHSHTQDIVKHEVGDKFIFDIQTGSATTYPCPLRIITLEGGVAKFSAQFLKGAKVNTAGQDFAKYAQGFIERNTAYMLPGVLNIPEALANMISPFASRAIIANNAGDECASNEENMKLNALEANLNSAAPGVGTQIKQMLLGIWSDMKPADNTISIDLSNGGVK